MATRAQIKYILEIVLGRGNWRRRSLDLLDERRRGA